MDKTMIKKCVITSMLTVSILLFFLHSPLVNATGPYQYLWRWSGQTSENYTVMVPQGQPDTFASSGVEDRAKYTTMAVVAENLTKEFAKIGVSAVITDMKAVGVISVSSRIALGSTFYLHVLTLNLNVSFSTDKQIMPGQLDPATATLIATVIGYIIAGLVASFAIWELTNWLTSMTTRTTTVTKYDVNGNPVETVTTTGADYGGMLTLIIGIAAVAIAGYLIIFGSKKRR